MDNLKKCSKCGEIKHVSMFGKDARKKDGLRPNCKDCKKLDNKTYRCKNKERLKTYNAAYRNLHKEIEKCRKIAWRIANPEAIINKHSRRREMVNSSGKLSKGIVDKLYKLQKGKCACCGEKLGNNYHVDHIVPLILGGKNEDNNVQLLRSRCNLQKGKKHPIDFMQSKGYLL